MIKKLFITALLSMIGLAASAQWGIGMRDTRYVNVSYGFHHGFSAKLEQSLYAEKFGYQYLRLYAGWQHSFGMVTVSAEPYFGMTYNNTYSSEGIAIGAAVEPLKWLDVEAAVVPHNDSELGYTTCYNVGLGFNCTSAIAITGALTNRPEYREPQRRVQCGVRFNSGRLWVHPRLSFPAGGNGKNMRVLVSMGYTF